MTVTSVTYFRTHSLWTHTVEDIRDLERSYASLLSDTQNSQVAFLDEIKNFENAGDQQLGTIQAVQAMRHALVDQLQSREQQLNLISHQQQRANALISEFEQTIAGTEGLLQSVVEEKSFLKERLEAAQGQLAEVSQQRDAGQRIEMGLRWRLTKLENELQQRASGGNDLWLKDWMGSSANALNDLIAQTGIDPALLISRVEDQQAGQGGPYQVASVEGVAQPENDPSNGDFHRLALLQKIAASLPLASPLDHYTLTSSFGKRSDPITGELAFHGGLDFGAAPNTRIRATARGRVVHAGLLGPYGNAVEIDHGMGVTTRFAHMKEVRVKVGQDVQLRDVIGIIGSTGRSTGRHLHYEVRLDGEAFDPAKFVNAGRYLVWAFASASS